MLTDLDVINLGLAKIAASSVSSISPPRGSTAAFMAAHYPQWKKQELAKRRWVFATERNKVLTLVDTLTAGGIDLKYIFATPGDMLRPIRGSNAKWVMSGRFIHSPYQTQTISYIRDATEDEFDPLFTAVLASKIALESAEFVTQSNTKKDIAKSLYDEDVSLAGKANAFVIGPEAITDNDEAYSHLTSRW